ncbi:putative bifunctional diguanylate cyclase/phosphodiesterase [Rhizobium sp. CFBP 8762]|uniref:putative bifunctional diguanylate cyclase/phosphodiesterase n=1 Tax=Rhizobium sp. CFBP 8762 TaxID=2775279 RepID=UPI0018D6D863|nr:EAL domain-containing protein [Rhizobium sp. CFBP 8762]
MQMDLLSAGQELAATPAAKMTAGPYDYRSIDRVIKHVVQATECTKAMVCRKVDGVFELISSVVNPSSYISFRIDNNLLDALALHIHDTPDIQIVRLNVNSILAPHCLAAARIRGSEETYLIALYDSITTLPNPAQTYLLQAHAAHLATVFELTSLREQTSIVEDLSRREDIERLRLLESVAVHARDSIIITEAEPIDLPGPRIIYCNAAITRATGYAAAELLGQTPRILQGPKTDPAARAKIRKALSSWKPIEIELINYRKDGTEFWVELSIVPVANDRGWYTQWVSVQRDITERKQAEALGIRVRDAEHENGLLATEILERKKVEAELLYTAFHDSLTRLRNRAFFMERLASALQPQPFAGACSVLFLDLNRFKIVNDSLGHIEGDALLQEIAVRLTRCVRPEDTLARVGGDEFAILIENASDLATPVRIAERIIEAMRSPVQLGRQSIFPSCSIGIAYSADRTDLPEDLIRDADIAMYEAKRTGFGDYAVFDASMRAKAVERLTLQTDLRSAVKHNEFYLTYQPIVDGATCRVRGLEALLRWNHPERGEMIPCQFVPVAEEIGLIRQIGRYVLQEGCQQLRYWQTQFSMPDMRLSVNTSATEFMDPGFVDELSATLEQFDFDPECLEIEITEGIFLDPSPNIAATIAAVRSLGVRVALDDFGTGYSSLSYINRYPIDAIKIDKSFIDDIVENPQTLAIVDMIVKLGKALGLDIVAEGVESERQVAILQSIGCGSLQGYHFAAPLAKDEVVTWLASAL